MEPDWVAFEVARSQFIQIHAMLNDIPAIAILDSGATKSVVDMAFAQRMGITSRGGFEAKGMTSMIAGDFAGGLRLKAGPLEIPKLNAAILDLSEMASIAGHPIDLVLGQELFEVGIIEIEFAAGRLRIWPLGTNAGRFGKSIALQMSGEHLRTVSLTLPGLVRVPAVIDLGSNVPLYLSPRFVARKKLLAGLRTSTSASGGIEGVVLSLVASLPSVELAGIQFEHVPVQVPTAWNFTSDAVIGLPLISRLIVALDFVGMRAWFRASVQTLVQPFPKDRSGLGTRLAGEKLLVVHVAPGSPAEFANIKVGDEIVSINGFTMSKNWYRNHAGIGKQPEGTKLILGLADGRVVTLILTDYF
jgi:hypothetical protein